MNDLISRKTAIKFVSEIVWQEGETAAKTSYDCMHKLTNGYVITTLGGNRFADIQIKCPNCGKVLGYV